MDKELKQQIDSWTEADEHQNVIKKLKKRITKLEKAVQNQPLEIIRILYDISGENMMKSKTPYQKKE